jgi:hypothetical protein
MLAFVCLSNLAWKQCGKAPFHLGLLALLLLLTLSKSCVCTIQELSLPFPSLVHLFFSVLSYFKRFSRHIKAPPSLVPPLKPRQCWNCISGLASLSIWTTLPLPISVWSGQTHPHLWFLDSFLNWWKRDPYKRGSAVGIAVPCSSHLCYCLDLSQLVRKAKTFVGSPKVAALNNWHADR